MIAVRVLLAILVFAAGIAGQTTSASDPAFEVASVRPADFRDSSYEAGYYAGAAGAGCVARDIAISGTLVRLSLESICDLIVTAYNVHGFQVLGAPSLPSANGMSEAAALVASHPAFFYDIQARTPGASAASDDQLRAMLRTLLANRFSLKLHHETREMSYYALTIGKHGTKLMPSKPDCQKSRNGQTLDAMLHVCGASMQKLTQNLNGAVDKPVVDATGLTGTFDYDIRAHTAADAVADYEQFLGLTLESRKGPIDVIVVDHVEPPLPN